MNTLPEIQSNSGRNHFPAAPPVFTGNAPKDRRPTRPLTVLLLLLLVLPVARGNQLPSIAVSDFTCDQRTVLTRGLPDMLAEALVHSGRFEVYEREKLHTIMREQGLQASGFVDPQTSVSLGSLAGVHYILTGKITDYGIETRDFRGYGVSTRTMFYRLKATARIVDVKTGRLLFSKTDGVEEKVTESLGLRVGDTTMDARLAEQLAVKLIKALLETDSFKPAGESAAPLVSASITSTPGRADVEVDGVFYGNAGGALKLPAGLRLITVSLPGYETWSKKVLVQEGLTINTALARKADARIEIKAE